jgi:hypothetical protein
MFICYACQPVVSALLWGLFIDDTPVVNYSNVAFFLPNLSSSHWLLVIARRSTWSLVDSFLSTVLCEVTRLSAKETGEDFPLSVLLNGPSWISSFAASSYLLFVSVSSWEEIFCFGYPSARSSWRSVHGIWIPLRVSPLVTERLPGGNGWHFLGFETVRPVPHVNVYSLLVDGRRSPLFVCCRLWESP